MQNWILESNLAIAQQLPCTETRDVLIHPNTETKDVLNCNIWP